MCIPLARNGSNPGIRERCQVAGARCRHTPDPAVLPGLESRNTRSMPACNQSLSACNGLDPETTAARRLTWPLASQQRPLVSLQRSKSRNTPPCRSTRKRCQLAGRRCKETGIIASGHQVLASLQRSKFRDDLSLLVDRKRCQPARRCCEAATGHCPGSCAVVRRQWAAVRPQEPLSVDTGWRIPAS